MSMTMGVFANVDAVAPDHMLLHAAPMSHGSGLYILPYVAAIACQLLPESRQFDPAEVLDLLSANTNVSLFAAPTMVHRMVQEAAGRSDPASGLRTIFYGGGPMYVEDCRTALATFGPRLVQLYAQGETPMTATVLPKWLHVEQDGFDLEETLASVGIAQSGIELRIVDGSGASLPAGEVGEIVIRGPSVMLGYLDDPQATAQTIKDGWLHTGDVGQLSKRGLLTLKDRSKDLIVSGGSNIYPREVEEVLLRQADVSEVAVVGRPSPEWGEEVVAFIVSDVQAQPTSDQLDQLCNERIARFKRPKTYRFVRELPKNNYGKVMKTDLREMVANEDAE